MKLAFFWEIYHHKNSGTLIIISAGVAPSSEVYMAAVLVLIAVN